MLSPSNVLLSPAIFASCSSADPCSSALVLESLTRHPGCHVSLRLSRRQAVALADLGYELRLVLDLGQIQVRERRPSLLGICPVTGEPGQVDISLAADKAEHVPLLYMRLKLRLTNFPCRVYFYDAGEL